MKRDRAVILLPAMIFMLWTGVLFSGNKVRAEELAPVEVTLIQRELTVSEGEMLTIIPLLEQSVGIHSYQWYRDDVEVEGQTKKTLEILSVTLEDAGEYKLVVTTTVGSETVQAESETCAVTVLEAQDGFHSEESSGPENDQPGEDAGTHGSAEASGSDESHTQQGGEPESDEAPDSSKDTDPSEEE